MYISIATIEVSYMNDLIHCEEKSRCPRYSRIQISLNLFQSS